MFVLEGGLLAGYPGDFGSSAYFFCQELQFKSAWIQKIYLVSKVFSKAFVKQGVYLNRRYSIII